MKRYFRDNQLFFGRVWQTSFGSHWCLGPRQSSPADWSEYSSATLNPFCPLIPPNRVYSRRRRKKRRLTLRRQCTFGHDALPDSAATLPNELCWVQCCQMECWVQGCQIECWMQCCQMEWRERKKRGIIRKVSNH